MPVVVEMRLVWLASGFHEQRRLFRECHRNRVGTGSDGYPHLEVAVEILMRWRLCCRCLVQRNRLNREQIEALTIEHQLDLMRLEQPLDMLVTIASEANRN